jgi:hypothetical protein
VVGWPDLAGEAILRRGDIRVLAIDADDLGSSFVRRLERADVEAEVVEPGGAAAAVLAADVLLVEALAASTGEMVAVRGSRAAASAILQETRAMGGSLPAGGGFLSWFNASPTRVPWQAEADVLPLALFSATVWCGRPDSSTLVPECPLAPELLQSSVL